MQAEYAHLDASAKPWQDHRVPNMQPSQRGIRMCSSPCNWYLIASQVDLSPEFNDVSQSNPSIHRSCKKILNGINTGEIQPEGSKTFEDSDKALCLVKGLMSDFTKAFIWKEKLSSTGDHFNPRVQVV